MFSADHLKLLSTLVVAGAIVLSASTEAREIHVTVDFNDDYRKAGGPVKRANIEEQITRFAELGIKRVYWIHDAEDMFQPRPLSEPGDLMETAVKAAHRNGLEIYALFKPFETGRAGAAFPEQIPLLVRERSIRSLGGFHPIVAPFVLKHPEFRLRRHNFDAASDRAINRITLIKADDQPTRLRATHLQLLVGETNGVFRPHEGSLGFRDTVERRRGRRVRMLTLSGLSLPPSTRYVLIRSKLADKDGDFSNFEGRMIELHDAEGRRIPGTVDEGRLSRDKLIANLSNYFVLRTGQAKIPEGVLPPDYGRSPAQTAFHFDTGATSHRRTLDGAGLRDGMIAIARGHNTHTVGALHPSHPEVRDYWRQEILTRCVNAGIDGVTIRIANHSSWSSEGAMFGFNAPAVDAFHERHGDGPIEPNDPRWRQIQGEFFTRFLRELKQDLKRRDVKLQLSVNHLMLKPIPGWRKNNVPENFRFEWEKWISEGIADSIELKYFPWPFGAYRGTGMEMVPEIARLARQHNQPVYFNIRFDTGIPWREVLSDDSPPISPQDPRLAPLRTKLRAAWRNPDLNGIILYEGASFTRMTRGTGKTRSAPFVKTLLQEMRD